MNLIAIVLQAARPSILPQLIIVVAFIAIFYFLILRPQRKMQQTHRDMVTALKKGDEVMTEGGLIGQVLHLTEDRITLRTAESTRVVVARAKIARVFGAEGTAPSTPEAK